MFGAATTANRGGADVTDHLPLASMRIAEPADGVVG
jgi:hypothetical protein